MGGFEDVTLTPLCKLMFAPQNDGRGLVKGDRSLVLILIAAVLVLLLFAVSNYINLTVCNTGLRAKEMATCRLMGCSAKDVAAKLIAESTLMVAISFLIGLLLAFLLQDKFASLFRGRIILQNDILPGSVAVCVLFIALLGLLSGIIPSLQLSRYKQIDVVKGSFRHHSKMVGSRVSVFVQNVITVAILTLSLVFLLQMNHLADADLGYNTKDIVGICPDHGDVVRSKLESLPCIEEIGLFNQTSLIGQPCSMRTFMDASGNEQLFYLAVLDRKAVDVYGLTLLSDDGEADGWYLNETGAERLGVKAGDAEFTAWEDGMHLSGIIKDFHTGNILNAAVPFAIRIKDSDSFESPSLIVRTDGSSEAMKAINQIVVEADGKPEELGWKVNSYEELVSASFSGEKNMLRIIRMFTIISIIISILGFIGLSLFFTRQRRKEIGIRKIAGSSSWEAWTLMFRLFYTPIVFSMIPAVIIAWLLMQHWLEGFSYRIALSPWIFIVTCVLSMLLAVISVGPLILRAVRANPADSITLE